MNIIITGPQGSGKGTQAELLAKKHKLIHLSTGELLRQEVAKGTALGKEAGGVMAKGELIPDDLTNSLMEMVVTKYKKQNLLLDGYPRTAYQAQFISKSMPIDVLLDISITDEEAVRRISARRECKQCGAGFNLITLKPKKEGTCDACGGALIQRADDNPAAIKKRLAAYHKNAAIIKKTLRCTYIKINGDQSIADVARDIENALHLPAVKEEISSKGFFSRLFTRS